MAKVPYKKPALTLQAQVEQLKARGMTFADEAAACAYLGSINYYRLTAYWLPFEADHGTHRFRHGTAFEAVLDSYVFDRELRLLLLDAIERVEVALRTRFAYHLGHTYGPHALLDSALFQVSAHGRWTYAGNLRVLQGEVADSKEVFIQHLRNKYVDALPPVWATVEVMTLGELSKWYANLRHSADRNAIARSFGLDEVILVSFMHHLAIVRNLCAHHSRVWSREFTFTFKLPRHRPAAALSSFDPAQPKRLYNTLVMLAYLLDLISPGHHWKGRLADLVARHRVPISPMGIPADWARRAIWL